MLQVEVRLELACNVRGRRIAQRCEVLLQSGFGGCQILQNRGDRRRVRWLLLVLRGRDQFPGFRKRVDEQSTRLGDEDGSARYARAFAASKIQLASKNGAAMRR